jgi:RNA 2',3'-cyclic 3'-phosphodiesterase
MRLFTAIDLPSDILLRLDRLLSALRPEALIKWSPIDNLHITTKFIGEWPELRVPELHDTLHRVVVKRQPFEVELKDLGWFPGERSPRVLWLGAENSSDLSILARDIEEALLTLGIPKEDRGFSPHLTLARIKGPVPLSNLRRKVQEMQPAAIGKFLVTHFSLFRSRPGTNASIYEKLSSYEFESVMAAS